jgi:hypothetical protein
MKITLKDLGRFAGEFLHVLQRENIYSTQDLETRAQRGGQKFMINMQESLIIIPRLSKMGTFASTMSYDVQGEGIPIELRINRQLNYTKSIIKFAGTIPGYTRFAADDFGNITQDILWMSFELPRLIEHLRELKSYGEK